MESCKISLFSSAEKPATHIAAERIKERRFTLKNLSIQSEEVGSD